MLSARETWVTSKSGKVKVFGEFVLDYKMPGLFAWKYKNTHTHSNTCIKNITHTYTGDSSLGGGVLSFAWLPHTSAECQLSFLFCTWRRWGNDAGEQKHQTTKRVPNNAAIFVASSAAVSFSSPSSSSLYLPLPSFVLPTLHIHTPS